MQNKLNPNQIQAFIIDMDGVLWRGNEPLPGLARLFDLLKKRSHPFVLATNNSTKTPQQYLQKLANFGIRAGLENILSSSLATAAYLRREYKAGASVYVVGQEGLHQAMREAGFSLRQDAGRPADLVVAGAHFALTYDNLKYGTLLIRGGARFIGTNGDLTFPSEEGLIPGAGSILAALEAATGVKPTIIGKPERMMFDIAVEKMKVRYEQTAMIGDRLDTDILGGQRAGLKTVLVTTGVDSQNAIRQKGIYPDAVFSGLDQFVETWSR